MRWINFKDRFPGTATEPQQVSSKFHLRCIDGNYPVTVNLFNLYGNEWGIENYEWLDEDPTVLCSHCGDEIEAPICKNCEMQLTMPTEEY